MKINTVEQEEGFHDPMVRYALPKIVDLEMNNVTIHTQMKKELKCSCFEIIKNEGPVNMAYL